jgi:hypothetical protein
MSSKVVVLLEDDVDGGRADETIQFGLDGAAYEIDLTTANAKKLRDALDGYVSKARKVGGRRSGRKSAAYDSVDLKAVRAWAASNGIEVSGRGRVSQSVLEQYRAAGN